MLYFGDTAGNNIKASQFVTDLSTDEELAAFITSQPDRVLTVVDVSLLRWAGDRGAGCALVSNLAARQRAGCGHASLLRRAVLLACVLFACQRRRLLLDSAGGAAVEAALGGFADPGCPASEQPPYVVSSCPPARSAAPCVHIFPAVLALATNFQVTAQATSLPNLRTAGVHRISALLAGGFARMAGWLRAPLDGRPNRLPT